MSLPCLRLALFLIPLVTGVPAGAAPEGVPPPPAPMDLPAPGPATAAPYAPRALLPGGVVVPLYPPDSPLLNRERVSEPEDYRSYSPPFLGYLVNIHNPSIEFHRGNGELNTGAAVIVVAGGGHQALNVVGEGMDVVPFLARHGISTIILRNRLRRDGYDPKTDAVNDVLQAVKWVRAYATEWNLDPQRIGVLGFSAGAELAAAAALEYETFDARHDVPGNPLGRISSRPDFVGLLYPGPSPFFQGGSPVIPRDAPPAFFASPGWGDWIHALWATEFFTALLNDGVPNVEMHIYARGVHPGDRGREGQPPATAGINRRGGVGFGRWEERWLDWLDDLGFMAEPGVVTRAALDVQAQRDRVSPWAALQERMRQRRAESAP